MALKTEHAALVAGALLRLRQESIGSLSRATGIRAANLSVWLRGASQVISEARVAKILHHLGARAGQLRSDIVHQWHIEDGVEDLVTVLTQVVDEDVRRASVLFKGEDRGGVSCASALYLPCVPMEVFVVLSLHQGMRQAPALTPELLGVGAVRSLPLSLDGLTSKPLPAVVSLLAEEDSLLHQALVDRDNQRMHALEAIVDALPVAWPDSDPMPGLSLSVQLAQLAEELGAAVRAGWLPQDLRVVIASLKGRTPPSDVEQGD